MRYIQNEQCRTCEYVDSNANGLYCSLILPPPEYENGECSKYTEDVRIPYNEEG